MTKDSQDVARIALLLLALILGIWFSIPFLIRHFVQDNWETSGSFGDTFGAANALFSGLALAGVVIAIRLQTRELRHQIAELGVQNQALKLQAEELAGQRKELEETRNVMERQLKQLQAQGIALERQNFERSFFELLSLHHNIVSSIEVPNPSDPSRSRIARDAFVCFKDQMMREVQNRKNESDKVKIVKESYAAFMHNYQTYIGHYFRHLYTILKFVDMSNVADKRFYTNIVRAQLSSGELALLYYNCHTHYGEKLKPLLMKYALLHEMRKNYVHESVWGLYEKEAYGIES